MKKSIITIFLVLISSLATFNFSSFTHPVLIFLVPGIFFGLTLTLPNLKKVNVEKASLYFFFYPILWAAILVQYIFLQFVTNSENDLVPYIIFGLTSGVGIGFIYKYQFGFKKDDRAFLTLCVVSTSALILGSIIFKEPHQKELNLGKLILIWQIFVTLGIIVNQKETLHNSR